MQRDLIFHSNSLIRIVTQNFPLILKLNKRQIKCKIVISITLFLRSLKNPYNYVLIRFIIPVFSLCIGYRWLAYIYFKALPILVIAAADPLACRCLFLVLADVCLAYCCVFSSSFLCARRLKFWMRRRRRRSSNLLASANSLGFQLQLQQQQ